MVQIRRTKTFKSRYAVTDAQGFVNEWSGRFGREGATGLIDGEPYVVRRDGRKRFVLEGGGSELATVERASRSGRQWNLLWDGRTYDLGKPSMWRTKLELRADGATLGTITRRRRNVTCDLPDELPTGVQAFLGFVAMALWDRDAAASTGGSVAVTG